MAETLPSIERAKMLIEQLAVASQAGSRSMPKLGLKASTGLVPAHRAVCLIVE